MAINQGGVATITVANRAFNDYVTFPIRFTKVPIVTCTNVSLTLDNDEWVTSAISEVLADKFKYQSAQNGVSKLHWHAIGK